jgi:hypothetical protein
MNLGKFETKFYAFLLRVYVRKHLVIFLLAAIALSIVALNVFGIISAPFDPFTQSILLCSTAFIILFLPSYPIFFLIIPKKKFNLFEKLGITVTINLAFYILMGYFGNSIGIPINGAYFFIAVILLYGLLIVYSMVRDVKQRTIFFQRNDIIKEKKQIDQDFSLISYIKNKIPLTGLILIIFLILLSVLHSVRFSYFYGTDAMYHVFLMNWIAKAHFLPVDQYFGALGLHIFGAVIKLFSSFNVILIGKYFLFYTFFVSALIFYNILVRIFKNRNIAILGVFLLESSSLGFSVMMYEFWPTSLATIISLEIFFLLYVRLKKLIKPDRPDKASIFSNMILIYVLIIVLGVSAIFTHSLIAMIFIVSFSFIYLIYFVKNYRRGIDFAIMCILLGIFLLLYDATDISRHWKLVHFLSLPWYLLVLGVAGGVFIVLYLRRGINFSTRRFGSIIRGEKYKYYKTFEDKYLFPILYSSIVIIIAVFWYLNITFLNLYFSKVFILIETLIFAIFCYWGLVLFQKKPRGKPLYLWLIGLIIIYIGAFSLDVFVLHEFWSGRILLLFSPVLIIGFMAYIYKIIKVKSINKFKMKFFILFVVSFSFFAQYSDLLIDKDEIDYSLYHRDVTSIYYYANYTSDRNLIICKFGLPYVLYYFDFPYSENNKTLTTSDLYIINQNPLGYFKPEDHFYPNGTNKLQQLKAELNTNVYLILDANYLVFGTWQVYQRLTPEEVASYYYMDYLNRIASCKSENGIDIPYYWVI